MRPPPPLSSCLRYPITFGIGALAILATLRYWSGADIGPFVIDDDWVREPWRLLTCVLFHADLIHLLFNLYWLWVFGTKVEEEFGQPRSLGTLILLAVGSSSADYALSHGGIGLSGVGYGLFGLLLVLSRKQARFADAVDRQTIQLFVVWFFLCIALTMAGVWRIANVAHGAGFVFGGLLAWTIVAPNVRARVQRSAILAALLMLCLFGASIGRPYVKLLQVW